MDKLVNAAIEISRESENIKKSVSEISEMHDSFIKLRGDIESEKSARVELAKQLRQISSSKIIQLAQKSQKNLMMMNTFTFINFLIFTFSLITLFTVLTEISGIGLPQYLRGELSRREKIALCKNFLGIQPQEIQKLRENWDYNLALTFNENFILLKYRTGIPIGILGERKSAKGSEVEYYISSILTKEEEEEESEMF